MSRRPSGVGRQPRALGRGAALLLVVAALPGCGGSPCPLGTTADPARVEAIEERLAASPAAREALAGRERAPICFVDGERSTLSADGVVRLDQRLDLDAAAARAAHLRLHAGELVAEARQGEEAACDERVAAALRAEARGHDLELRVARELGAPLPVFAFTAEWEAAGDARVDVIERWLVAHPDGGQGVDALGADYRRRCERGREE